MKRFTKLFIVALAVPLLLGSGTSAAHADSRLADAQAAYNTAILALQTKVANKVSDVQLITTTDVAAKTFTEAERQSLLQTLSSLRADAANQSYALRNTLIDVYNQSGNVTDRDKFLSLFDEGLAKLLSAPDNSSYFIQHQPVFSAGQSTPPVSTPPVVTPPSTGAPSFIVTKTGPTRRDTTVGASSVIYGEVVDTSSAITSVIVDLEVHDASNNKVYQKFFTDQSFTNQQKTAYQSAWTPSKPGTYKFQVGVFANDWSKLYSYNDSVETITVK